MAVTPLCTVVVDLGDERWLVRSALPTRPIAGDRIRYPVADATVELDVRRVIIDVGVTGSLEVITGPAFPGSDVGAALERAELERRLLALRFRQEAQDAAPTT